jgi:hypothetical protein
MGGYGGMGVGVAETMPTAEPINNVATVIAVVVTVVAVVVATVVAVVSAVRKQWGLMY